MLTARFLVARTTAGGAAGKSPLPGVCGGGGQHAQPPDQPASLSSPPLPLSFWWIYLFSERAHEQTCWGIPLNQPSLSRIPALLFKQSWGRGPFPRPCLSGNGPRGEGRVRNARQLPHPRRQLGGQGAAQGETTRPPPTKGTLTARQEAQRRPGPRLRPRGSLAHPRNGKTSCPLYLPGCQERRSGDGGRPPGRGARGLQPTPHPRRALWDQRRGRGSVPLFQEHVAPNFPPGPHNSGGASSSQTVKCRAAQGTVPSWGPAPARGPARELPSPGSGAPGPRAAREGAALPVPGGVGAGPALLRAPLVRGGGGRLSLAQVTEAGRTHELQPAESPHGDPEAGAAPYATPCRGPLPAPRLYEETWARAGSRAALRGPAPGPRLRPGPRAGRPAGLIIAPSGRSVERQERGRRADPAQSEAGGGARGGPGGGAGAGLAGRGGAWGAGPRAGGGAAAASATHSPLCGGRAPPPPLFRGPRVPTGHQRARHAQPNPERPPRAGRCGHTRTMLGFVPAARLPAPQRPTHSPPPRHPSPRRLHPHGSLQTAPRGHRLLRGSHED